MNTSRRGFLALLGAAIAAPRHLFAARPTVSVAPSNALTMHGRSVHVRFTDDIKIHHVHVPFVGPDGQFWQRTFELPKDQAEFDAFIGRDRDRAYGRSITQLPDSPFVKLEDIKYMADRYRPR